MLSSWKKPPFFCFLLRESIRQLFQAVKLFLKNFQPKHPVQKTPLETNTTITTTYSKLKPKSFSQRLEKFPENMKIHQRMWEKSTPFQPPSATIGLMGMQTVMQLAAHPLLPQCSSLPIPFSLRALPITIQQLIEGCKLGEVSDSGYLQFGEDISSKFWSVRKNDAPILLTCHCTHIDQPSKSKESS